MNIWLALAFLFSVGAVAGWCLEFLFRNLISHKGPRGLYFINPGFCHGPYLPLYGTGLVVLFLITNFVSIYIPDANSILVIVIITIVLTLVEFIGGTIMLDKFNMRLWDYRNNWGNYRGIVCPLFTLIWGTIGAIYYLFIHELTFGWLTWLSQNLACSFFVGLFFGVFLVDWALSTIEAKMIKEFGENNDVIVKFDELKSVMMKKRVENKEKKPFFNQIGPSDQVQEIAQKALDKLGDNSVIFEKKKKKKKMSFSCE